MEKEKTFLIYLWFNNVSSKTGKRKISVTFSWPLDNIVRINFIWIIYLYSEKGIPHGFFFFCSSYWNLNLHLIQEIFNVLLTIISNFKQYILRKKHCPFLWFYCSWHKEDLVYDELIDTIQWIAIFMLLSFFPVDS